MINQSNHTVCGIMIQKNVAFDHRTHSPLAAGNPFHRHCPVGSTEVMMARHRGKNSEMCFLCIHEVPLDEIVEVDIS